ncbi:hypothetical protein MNBD_NITROSPINAE02-1148 [hydrothermal vent metagenome]|uniref:Glycosyltransferase n=1 Tax=hydrothermal vent metagenome TaxID=652676 RepID=A0A3B1CN81_9ZZZZ
MKILLVGDYGTATGGAEIFTLMLRDGLRRRGHDARLFTSSACPGSTPGQADYECFGTTLWFRALLQTANPWAYWKLRRILMEFKPDVVHVGIFLTQLSPLILPLLKNVPSVYRVHWYRPICLTGTKMMPDRSICSEKPGSICYRKGCLPLRDWLPLTPQMKLLRRWLGVFNLFVANSEFTKSCLIEENIGPVTVITPGVQNRPPRPLLSDPPTVVFAGRLVREKGVDVLLQAFAKVVKLIPEARLFVAGAGSEKKSLKLLIVELGLSNNVSMQGHLSHLEMENRFNDAWVQMVPSLFDEPFGMVAVEAMVRGTAVIASDCGGLIGIVEERRTGFLTPPGDIDALADAILRVLQDRELAERLGATGRQVASTKFTEKKFVNRFIEIYENLLAHNGKAAND